MTADLRAPDLDRSGRDRPPRARIRPAHRLVNPPDPDPSTGTVAVVLAAGLGTRMRSSLPKVLHPMCGRPMIVYVLDAWASTADGAAGGRPSSSTRRRSRQSPRPFAGRATSGPPGRAAGHGRRGPGRPRGRPRRRPRDPRPVRRRAARDRCGPRHDPRAPAAKTTPRSRSPASTPRIRPSSVGSSAASSGRSRRSSRRRTRRPTSSWATRSTPACTRSMRRGCAGGSSRSRRRRRPASST